MLLIKRATTVLVRYLMLCTALGIDADGCKAKKKRRHGFGTWPINPCGGKAVPDYSIECLIKEAKPWEYFLDSLGDGSVLPCVWTKSHKQWARDKWEAGDGWPYRHGKRSIKEYLAAEKGEDKVNVEPTSAAAAAPAATDQRAGLMQQAALPDDDNKTRLLVQILVESPADMFTAETNSKVVVGAAATTTLRPAPPAAAATSSTSPPPVPPRQEHERATGQMDPRSHRSRHWRRSVGDTGRRGTILLPPGKISEAPAAVVHAARSPPLNEAVAMRLSAQRRAIRRGQQQQQHHEQDRPTGRTYEEMLAEEARARVTRGQAVFRAFDCRHPVNIRDVAYKKLSSCTRVAGSPRASQETVQILYREQHLYTDGYRCRVWVTRRASYCGAFDHSTPLDRWTTVNKPHPISVQQCKEMVRSGKFMVGEQGYTVGVGVMSAFSHEAIGHYSAVDGSEIKCQGGEFRVGDKKIPDTVVVDSYNVWIENEKFRTNDQRVQSDGHTHADPDNPDLSGNTVTAQANQQQLPCAMADGGCRTMMDTYTWQVPTDVCRLGYTANRTVTGTVVSEGGDTVFMSTDDSLIRVVLSDRPTSECDRQIWGTNFDNIFVLRDTGGRWFHRQVNAQEVDLGLYARARDSALQKFVQRQVRAEYEHVLEEDCKYRTKQQKKDYYLQWSDTGLMTFMLNNATFGVSAGETIYLYRCRETLVKAVTTYNHCFEALPVTPVDLSLPAHEQRHVNMSEVVFMQPITRRLLPASARVPCSKRFVPKYGGYSGNTWYSGGDSVHEVRAPDDFNDLEHADISPAKSPTWEGWDSQDFAKGGLFSNLQLAESKDVLTYVAARAAGTAQLYDHLRASGWDGTSALTPDVLVDEDSKHKWSLSFDPWEWIKGAMRDFGSGASIFVTLMVVSMALYKLVFACHNVKLLHSMYGCGKMLLWGFCPSLWTLRSHSRYHRQRRSDRIRGVDSPPPPGSETEMSQLTHSREEPSVATGHQLPRVHVSPDPGGYSRPTRTGTPPESGYLLMVPTPAERPQRNEFGPSNHERAMYDTLVPPPVPDISTIPRSAAAAGEAARSGLRPTLQRQVSTYENQSGVYVGRNPGSVLHDMPPAGGSVQDESLLDADVDMESVGSEQPVDATAAVASTSTNEV